MAITETLLANKIQIVIAAVVVVGGASASYVAMGGDVPFMSSSEIETVPEGADMVVYMDPNVPEDQATEELINGLIDIAKDKNDNYDGPDDYEEFLEEVEQDMNESDSDSELQLDIEKLNAITAYAQYPDDIQNASNEDLYLGLHIDSGWAEDDLIDQIEDGETTYSEDEYEGYTVYTEDTDDSESTAEPPAWIGVLSDGQYVFGTEQAVKDAIDVDRGELSSVNGELRNAYENTKSGSNTYFKYAFAMPEEDLYEDYETEELEGRFGAVRSIETVAGSYYTTSNTEIGSQVRIGTGSQGDAEEIRNLYEFQLTAVNQSVASDEARALVDNADVTQQGSTVKMTFESPVEDILDAVEVLYDEAEKYGGVSGVDSGYGTSSTSASDSSYDSDPGSDYDVADVDPADASEASVATSG